MLNSSDRSLYLLLTVVVLSGIGVLTRLRNETPVLPWSGSVELVEEGFGIGARALLLGKKLNINMATAADLHALPRLSYRVAQAIVAYRADFGPFRKLDDLLNVKGIGEKTLERLKEYVEIVK